MAKNNFVVEVNFKINTMPCILLFYFPCGPTILLLYTGMMNTTEKHEKRHLHAALALIFFF